MQVEKMIFSPLDALPDLNLILSDCRTIQTLFERFAANRRLLGFICLYALRCRADLNF
jgi:hypothetical protein